MHDLCFVVHPANPRKVIAIRRGESGYCETTYFPNTAEEATALVDNINQRLGVTAKERECMIVGSMFGWHVPGAQYKEEVE